MSRKYLAIRSCDFCTNEIEQLDYEFVKEPPHTLSLKFRNGAYVQNFDVCTGCQTLVTVDRLLAESHTRGAPK